MWSRCLLGWIFSGPARSLTRPLPLQLFHWVLAELSEWVSCLHLLLRALTGTFRAEGRAWDYLCPQLNTLSWGAGLLLEAEDTGIEELCDGVRPLEVSQSPVTQACRHGQIELSLRNSRRCRRLAEECCEALQPPRRQNSQS